jgi:hypothetical protein
MNDLLQKIGLPIWWPFFVAEESIEKKNLEGKSM